jgi:hypothetical protein
VWKRLSYLYFWSPPLLGIKPAYRADNNKRFLCLQYRQYTA